MDSSSPVFFGCLGKYNDVIQICHHPLETILVSHHFPHQLLEESRRPTKPKWHSDPMSRPILRYEHGQYPVLLLHYHIVITSLKIKTSDVMSICKPINQSQTAWQWVHNVFANGVQQGIVYRNPVILTWLLPPHKNYPSHVIGTFQCPIDDAMMLKL